MIFIKEIKLEDSIWGIQFNVNAQEGCRPYTLRHCSLDYKRFSDNEIFPFMTEKEAFDALEAVCDPNRIIKLKVIKELTTTIRQQVLDKVEDLLNSSNRIEYTSYTLLTLALQQIVAERI